jgi:hypothetical protein
MVTKVAELFAGLSSYSGNIGWRFYDDDDDDDEVPGLRQI